jgi:hypothetical protein
MSANQRLRLITNHMIDRQAHSRRYEEEDKAATDVATMVRVSCNKAHALVNKKN